MKERPIIFSTPMVQAIMAGRKTVTRRLSGLGEINKKPDDWQLEWMDYQVGFCFTKKSSVTKKSLKNRTFKQVVVKSPYGLKDDVLWVRESFMPFEVNGVKYNYFRADDPDMVGWKGKPSIHMPKTIACRWLRVENVRVERLHRINDNDATLEGIFYDKDSGYWFAGDTCMSSISALDCYISLWHHLNGPYSWAQNPYVWIINFSVLSPEESQKHLDNARA